MPLGGIGVGAVEVMTDGSFGQFTNQQNWDRPYGWARSAFAAIRVQSGSAVPVAKLLRLTSPEEYPGIANVQHTRTQGWFPRAHVDFSDTDLPVTVTLNAFSPLVPHDPKNSSLPVMSLSYTVTNTSKAKVSASLLLAWPNLIGWGGGGSWGNWDDTSGSTEKDVRDGKLFGVELGSTQTYSTSDPHSNVIGNDYLAVRTVRGSETSVCTRWDALANHPAFWNNFVATGFLRDVPYKVSKRTGAAVAIQCNLLPGESRTLRFYVAWTMPHHVTVHQSAESLFKPGVSNPPVDRWTTGEAQYPGESLNVDFGKANIIRALILDQGQYLNDYPRGLTVAASVDGKVWRPVANFSLDQIKSDIAGSIITLPLDHVGARYLKVAVTGSDPFYWWSVHELSADIQDHPDPIAFHNTTGDGVEDVGHYYQNWWHTPEAIATYFDTNYDRLLSDTMAWQTPILRSNLPFWLRLKLINCAFPMFTNTILTRDGRFVVQESPIDMGGATGTMDQRMAAHAIYTQLFPELDRAELELYAKCQRPDGSITHFDGNIHDVIGEGNVNYGITGWPDLSSAWVMQVAKLYRWTGDTGFLHRMLPHVDSAMAWLQRDGADDNLIPAGGSTYDYEQLPRGEFIYSASCYLGALRAAAAISDPIQGNEYNHHLGLVQQSVMHDLWNGTFFRKWHQPGTGQSVEDSFVANLAGDWLARLTGLPRTLPADIIHKSIAQTITRHQNAFYPVPPMQVTPDGKSTTSSCYLLQDEPYLGCEAIYENFVDDGLETLHRVYHVVWEQNKSPWDESLVYDAPNGGQGGLPTYMTCPATWHVLNALSGATLDLPNHTLYISPRLASDASEIHMPIYFSRFWAWLDYVPAHHKLQLKILRVFPENSTVQETLYHLPSHVTGDRSGNISISKIAVDGDARLIILPKPFFVKQGATLDLSREIDALNIPAKTEIAPKG